METPIVEKIYGGWAARGNGISVHGKTEGEAITKYQERQRFYSELRKRAVEKRVEQDGQRKEA